MIFKMEDKAEYSFWAKITENGCIDIPDEILAELDIEHQVNVCIKPNRMKNRMATIETDNFDMSFSILRSETLIHEKLRNTLAIQEDYAFLLHYYSPYNGYQPLDIPQLVGVLIRLYGEPDNFYDDYKSSFNYTFDFKITYKNKTPIREVKLVMEIFDYKDSLYIEFRRFRENSKDDVIKLIEDIVTRNDLNRCIIILHNYFSGFYEGYDTRMYDKFERYQPYSKIKYGYNGDEFYLIQEDEET